MERKQIYPIGEKMKLVIEWRKRLMEWGGDWWNRETDNHWGSGAILSNHANCKMINLVI